MANVPWSLVSPHGILIDESADAWWSGHVTDILELDHGTAGLLVATEMGGVWTVATNNMTVPLSDNWDQPNVNRLAAGPDGDRHFFAACDAGVIYETDVSQSVPLLNWKPVDRPLPAGVGDVRGIAVIRPQRIVLAATDGGLYWSTIPKRPARRGCLGQLLPGPPPPPALYDWKKAKEPALGQNGYFDVAIGSLTGRPLLKRVQPLSDVSVIVGGRAAGVFVGTFVDPNTLVLERGRLFDDQGNELTDWWFLSTGFTSVAVCEQSPTVAYAASAYPDGRFKMVIRSKDGGRRWAFTGFDLKNVAGQSDIRSVAGDQGNGWNNAIGVLKTGPGVVALGWQAGTFVSPDAGKTWIALKPSPHLHADVHVVRFRDTTPDDKHTLLIGSDGGIAEISVDDAFQMQTTARSDFNRQLPTLQCYGTWPIPRQFWGTLAASSWGFVATGVQDNGNIYLNRESGDPWRQMDGGDGGWTGFVEDMTAVRNIMGAAVTTGFRNANLIVGANVVRIESPPPPDATGLKGPVADVVRMPRYKNPAGHHLLAVAGSGSNVYGLFPDRNTAGSHRWERIGVVPGNLLVAAVGSHDGGTVHVGTTVGRFFVLDVKQGTFLELPVVLPQPVALTPQKGGQPSRIATLSSVETFAILNATDANLNYVLRLDALQWKPPLLSGLPITGPFYGLDGAFRERERLLFVSTDDRVYSSEDGGDNWVPETINLPRRPHCADIRVSVTRRGGSVLLSTFGRSVYQTAIGGLRWAP
jgi:hypothetical protein